MENMEWISGKIKPKECGKYLCFVCKPSFGEAYYSMEVVAYKMDALGDYYWDIKDGVITHYMELPNPPEEVF